ncbi:MAG: NAD(P)-dependent oxidoreductase [Chloroflexi bacterium]|nr:NAD(P)-dependent oxidoreductase [Chloroflexota bacterium]
MRLEGCPVLVTGGEGFIGRHLSQRLSQAGARVRVLARDVTRPSTDWERVSGDVILPSTVAEAAGGCELIFHCVAGGGGTLDQARAVNVEGTRHVMEAALASGSVRRVVHVSSVAVHGSTLPPLVMEDQPMVTSGSSYAVSKAEGERLASAYHDRSGLETVVVRPTCVYGPGSATWVLAQFRRVRDEQVLLVGRGVGIINLIYIDDLIDVLLLAATSSKAAGECFFASGGPVRWSDYLGAFARMQHKPAPPSVARWRAPVLAEAYSWRFRFTRKMGRLSRGDIQEQTSRTIFRTGKVQQLLGFVPRTTFEQGAHKVEAWLRASGYLASRTA